MTFGVDNFIVSGQTAADLNELPRRVYTKDSLAVEWPNLAEEALYGLAGRIVRAISPYTEADTVALLVSLLTGMGNLIGPGAYAMVGHDRHPCRIFAALVGATARARKGTAWSTPRHLLSEVDPEWARRRVSSGLSSGEGLISVVRDPRVERQPVKDKGRVVDYQDATVDHGEDDKRFLAIENEFAVVLKRMHREGNTVSELIRQAWETGNLSTITRSPLRATGAHISILAHITKSELRRHLTETERANGFANRFLWVLVRRRTFLPDGDAPPDALLAPFVSELRGVVEFGNIDRHLARDDEATAIWRSVYGPLSAGECSGNELLDAVTARADAQVLRLSLIYAVFDRSPFVRAEHLEAALALWRYAETSARLIFGDLAGDPVQDTILEALRLRGPLTRTHISNLFAGNLVAAKIEVPLRSLESRGAIRRQPPTKTKGRPVEVWELMPREGGAHA